MNLHEHQAKELLAAHGVPVPRGMAAFSLEEAVSAAIDLSGPPWVVKAQIHAGGRGKGGGVAVVQNMDELKAQADRILGMTLVSPQTGPAGRLVRRIYIEEASNIASEFYLSILVDRTTARIAFILSTEGGMDIEDVAAKTPDKILTMSVDPATGVSSFHGRKAARALNLKGAAAKQIHTLIAALHNAFITCDMSLLEINPLVLTKDDRLICLDAKISLDDNALFRHKDFTALHDTSEEDPAEVDAARHDLNYIKLDGAIGCMVNGAGLAMATMDIIKDHGMEPANFLDVGGGATREKVTEAFKIILRDPGVKGVLVNIFGGIMRCDIIAEGIIAAARETKLTIPLVVRLEGTNVEAGIALLNESGLAITPASDLGEAAEKITAAVKAS